MEATPESLEQAAPAMYGWLREAWNTAADDALLAVVLGGRSDYRRYALEALLARGREAGLARLVGHFDELPGELKEVLAASGPSLSSAVRAAIGDERFESRRSAIELVQTGGDCRQAYLLADALCHDDRGTRELASSALAAVTLAHVQRLTPTSSAHLAAKAETDTDAHIKDAEFLTSALQRALNAWDLHHRTEVLAAAMCLRDRMAPYLFQRSDEPRSKIARAISELLTDGHDPRLAPFALAALTRPGLRAAAVHATSTCTDPHYFAALLDAAWLLADPDVRRGCGFVKRLAYVEAGVESLLQLPGQAGRPDHAAGGDALVARAVRLIGASGLPADAKLAIYRGLFCGPSAAGRRAALWELLETDGAGADELLLCLIQWDDAFAPLARIALKKRRPDLDLSRDGASRSPSAGVVPDEFDGLWERFDSLTPEQRNSAVRRLRGDADRIDRLLRAKLASQRAQDRVRALRIIQVLGRGTGFADPIIRLAHDAEAVVRSAAVAALGVLDGASAVRVARQALGDADPRVRANAIEALDALDAPDRQRQIAPLLRADHQRVRANAIKSLLTLHVRDAAESLLDMLDHRERTHRASALWVIERLQLKTLLERIETLADIDDDPGVRRRAQRVYDSIVAPSTRRGRVRDSAASPSIAAPLPGRRST